MENIENIEEIYEIENAIKFLNEFIENFEDFSNNYKISEEEVNDIYDILESDIAEINIINYDKIKKLIEYQKKIKINIIKCVNYEDICKIIVDYIIKPNNINIECLEQNISMNLVKINTNLILQKIYKTAPRLITNPEKAIFDIIFEEETAKKKLHETLKYLKLLENNNKIK